jgi:hypothetical protein
LLVADRVDLALALWDSLDETDRESVVDPAAEQIVALGSVRMNIARSLDCHSLV